MKDNKVVLFVPHSSLRLSKIFKEKEKFISDREVEKFNYSMTDLLTSQLFSCKRFPHVKAKVSRIVCDVEKFIDDDKESMSKYGLGAIYTKTHKGEKLIDEDSVYKDKILKKYYFPVHKKLDKLTAKYLKNNRVILVDCHSFSKEIVLGKKGSFPDICIGINEKYIDENLINFTTGFFKGKGYKIRINFPYSGSMIPDNIFDKNVDNFYSIMLEINREIYLENFKINKKFNSLKKDIFLYLNEIKKLSF